MVIIAITLCAFFAFISLPCFKKVINPLFVFSVLWMIIIFLSSLQLFGLNPTDDKTYLITTIGIAAYGVGCLISRRVSIRRKHRIQGDDNNSHTNNMYYGVIYALIAVTLVFYLKDFAKTAQYLLNGYSLSYIRALAQDSTSILYSDRGVIESSIRMIIVQPFVMALQALVASEFWQGKHKWKLMIADLVVIFLRVGTDGSRSLIIYLVINLVVSFIFLGKKQQQSIYNWYIRGKKGIRNKLIFAAFIIAGVVLIYQTTLSRSDESSLKHTYYYFSMEPYMLQTWMNEVDMQNAYGYGLASINGFVFPIIYILKNLLGLQYPSYWYNNIFMMINNTDQVWQTISATGSPANAYVSIFWFPYLDGGIVGVIIIMLIFGFLMGRSFRNVCMDTSQKNVCLYSYLIQGIIFSFVRLQFANISYALGFAFIALIAFSRKRIKLKLRG